MPHQAFPIEILLVEDNPGDIELTREIFNESKIYNRIHVAHDGIEALDFLKRRGAFANATRPDMILLDLNMPRMDGRELLAIIRSDDELKSIPVAIMTGSDAEKSIVKSYKLHANCYINKPVSLERFLEMVKTVEGFWFSVVRLPVPENSKVA